MWRSSRVIYNSIINFIIKDGVGWKHRKSNVNIMRLDINIIEL